MNLQCSEHQLEMNTSFTLCEICTKCIPNHEFMSTKRIRLPCSSTVRIEWKPTCRFDCYKIVITSTIKCTKQWVECSIKNEHGLFCYKVSGKPVPWLYKEYQITNQCILHMSTPMKTNAYVQGQVSQAMQGTTHDWRCDKKMGTFQRFKQTFEVVRFASSLVQLAAVCAKLASGHERAGYWEPPRHTNDEWIHHASEHWWEVSGVRKNGSWVAAFFL